NQVMASVLGFVVLVAWLLLGELDDVAPGALGEGVLADALAAIDLRRRMDAFARGAVDLSAVALFVGVTAAGLAGAHAACALGRPRAAGGRRRLVIAGLVALDAALALAVCARHDLRWDASASDVNRLDPA